MTSPDRVEHWRKTRGLMLVVLGLWVLLSAGVHMFADAIDAALGLTPGFALVALASPVAFAALVFRFARRQSAIDAEHDVGED